LPNSMVVEVSDVNGNPVSGATVTWAIQNEPNGLINGFATLPPGTNGGANAGNDDSGNGFITGTANVQIFLTATSVTGPDGLAQMGFTTDPTQSQNSPNNIYQITASAVTAQGGQLVNSPVLFNEIGDVPIITVQSGGAAADSTTSKLTPNHPRSVNSLFFVTLTSGAGSLNATNIGDIVNDGNGGSATVAV